MRRRTKIMIAVITVLICVLAALWPRDLDGVYHFRNCLCEEPNYLLFHDGKIYAGHGFRSKLDFVGYYTDGHWRDSCTLETHNTDPIEFAAYSNMFGMIGYDAGFRRRIWSYEEAVSALEEKGANDLTRPWPSEERAQQGDPEGTPPRDAPDL